MYFIALFAMGLSLWDFSPAVTEPVEATIAGFFQQWSFRQAHGTLTKIDFRDD